MYMVTRQSTLQLHNACTSVYLELAPYQSYTARPKLHTIAVLRTSHWHPWVTAIQLLAFRHSHPLKLLQVIRCCNSKIPHTH